MEKFEVGDKVKVVRMDVNWNSYCPPLNKYIGQIGEVIAMDLLIPYIQLKFDDGQNWCFDPGWLELVEKNKKGWTGQVVCTSITYPCGKFFTPGKVYDVKDGYLNDRTGTPYTYTRFNSANDINDFFEATHPNYQFIEFKGFNENKEERK